MNTATAGALDGSTALADRTRGLTRAGSARVDVIDLLRGLVIVLMVLDHARDYLHSQAFVFDPTDISRTTPFLFATRWVTHLCAPTFVFLSGVSIFLQRANGKDLPSLTRFLLTRGLWLIVLELTIVSFGFNFAAPFAFVQVIWAIGFGMVLMAACVRLPVGAALALGVAIIAGHQLLAGVKIATLAPWLATLWRLMMQPGPAGFMPGLAVYPAIPWFGIMCLGYGLGSVFLQEPAARRRSVLFLGLGAIVLFVLLRFANGYGDPRPWSSQASDVKTLLSFLNVSKYPPSLMYVLVTLGVSLLLSLALEYLLLGTRFRGDDATAASRSPFASVLLVFGRTPLFTYLVHLYVLHTLSMLIGIAGGFAAINWIDTLGNAQRHAGVGFALWVAYVGWLATLALMYPLSRWFERMKRTRRDWWLSYA